jgi:hypothetical protein
MITGRSPGYLARGLGRTWFISCVGCKALAKNLLSEGGVLRKSVGFIYLGVVDFKESTCE